MSNFPQSISRHGKYIETLDNIASLRRYSTCDLEDGDVVATRAFQFLGDSDGAFFSWSQDSLLEDDGIKVIKPNDVVTGRWIVSIGKGTGATGAQGAQGIPGLGLTDVISPNGSTLVGYRQSPNAMARMLSDRLRESVSVTDFGALGDGVNDDTAAIQRAVDYVESRADLTSGSNSPANGPQNLFFPAGHYRITDRILITRSMSVYGDGHSEFSSGTRIIQNAAGKDNFRVEPIAQGCSISFTDMTLRAAGGGNTGGNLINIRVGPGRCNSVRIVGCTFGTPQNLAINVQGGDDYVISRCLFDVSALHNMAFGTSASTGDLVTNLRVTHCDFFDIALSGILLYNVEGFIITNNTVYSSTGMTSFIEGRDTQPALIRNGIVANNTFKKVKVLARLTNSINVAITSNTGDEMGEGAGATNSLIQLDGTNIGTVISNNRFTAFMGAKSFVEAEGQVQEAIVTNNSVKSNGGFGPGIEGAKITGVVHFNSFVGFPINSIGHRWGTIGNALTPGVVGGGLAVTIDLPVRGSLQGDLVSIAPSSTSWFVPVGIEFTAYISQPDLLTLRYVNRTNAAIGIPAHDIVAQISR